MRVLLIGVDREAKDAVRSAGHEVTVLEGPDVSGELRRTGYDALVVHLSASGDAGVLEGVQVAGVPVIAVLDAPDTELVRRLIRSGVRDVLFSPSAQEVVGALESIAQSPPPSTGGAGRIVAVISPQGGTGRSTIALNLGLLLAERGPVILIDLVPFYGILHVLADLEPSVTLGDVLAPGGATRERVASALIPYEGLRLLAAPPSPEGLSVTEEAADAIVGACAEMADYVIVDTERLILPYVYPVLERAHLVLCVTRMTVPALRNLKSYIQSFVHRHIPIQKVLVVGVGGPDAVAPRSVEEIVGVEIGHVLPGDRAAVLAENAGVPVVLGYPAAKISRSLEQLADLVVTRAGASEERLITAH